jgi:predicted peptidase
MEIELYRCPMALILRLACLAWWLIPVLAAGDDLAGFKARIFTDTDGRTMPYRLLMPDHYDRAVKYPVILLFHGSGERGIDNGAQLRHGAAELSTPAARAKFPAFIIVPQCPENDGWVNTAWSAPSSLRPQQPSESMQLAMKILDSVMAEFSTDKDRVYVMGISMGGYGVWDCITRYPQRFAAGVAVCGGGDENTVTAEVAQVPVWVFGSSDDPNVPPVRGLHMVEAMLNHGGHPRYYLYTDLGHVSWDKAFGEPDLLPWVFKQHRAKPTPG